MKPVDKTRDALIEDKRVKRLKKNLSTVKEKNLSSNFVDNDPVFSSHHINKKPTLSDLHFSPLEEEPLTPEEWA